MGLLSAFGVGGGKITVQLQTPSIQAGGAIQGVVTFAGGKRAQQITAIKLRLTRTHAGDPSGQGAPSQSQDIVPEHPISGPLAIQPQQMQYCQFHPCRSLYKCAVIDSRQADVRSAGVGGHRRRDRSRRIGGRCGGRQSGVCGPRDAAGV